MTTIADLRPPVTGGVDTHLDVHVAAVVTAVGGVLGTAEFPTTAAGYRRPVGWMRGFGELDQVGVEGTGTYGVSLARHLRAERVTVVEVMRPNRQVRRRYGKTDVVMPSRPRGLCCPGKPTPFRRPTTAPWRRCGR